jgi:hypothetical protein
MLDGYLVKQICGLLREEKLGYRQIARRTGVSRGSVARIAAEAGEFRRPVRKEIDDYYAPDVPPARCPECGELVYPPCLLCKTRRRLAKRPGHVVRRCRPDFPILVGLDLLPKHQKRYEKVRKRRYRKMTVS